MRKRLKLKGKAAVIIDWANVYGWTKSLGYEVDPVLLLAELKTYPEVTDLRFYFGRDDHPKSAAFLDQMEKLGYTLVTKPVKYILAAVVDGQKVLRRKCDFDMEACIDVHRLLGEDYQSFIFFTGDGDYEPLYKLLISLGKQVVVVYTAGHLGREIWQINRGLFKIQLKNLISAQNRPPETAERPRGA